MEEERRGIRFATLSYFFAITVVFTPPLPLTTGSLGSCFQIWECPFQAPGPGAGRVRPGVDDSSVPYRPFSRGQVAEPLRIPVSLEQKKGDDFTVWGCCEDHIRYSHLYKTLAQYSN